MKIALISGSHRNESQTGKVTRYIQGVLDGKDAVTGTYLLDLAHNDLPFWDESVWAGDERWKSAWEPIAKELQEADAVVVASPEWAGMVPAKLKNLFLLAGTAEFGDKPGMIVSVSGSRNGAYPVNELRTSSYKNCQLNYIPHHIIVRDVGDMLNGDEPADDGDAYIRRRIDYTCDMLIEYGKALKAVRESGVPNYKDYPFGM